MTAKTKPKDPDVQPGPAVYEVLDYIGFNGRRYVPGDLIHEPEDSWAPAAEPVASGDAMVLLRFEDPLGNRWAVTDFGAWRKTRAIMVKPPTGLANHENAGRVRKLEPGDVGVDWGQLHRSLAAQALVDAGVAPQFCEAYVAVLTFYPPDGGTLAGFVERLQAERPDLLEAIQAHAPQLIEEATQ